jgi:hypothetical protein
MIKFIVSGLVAISVLATPVAAEAKHRDRGGHERSYRHHSRISTGEAIAIGVGAFILGAAASSNRRDDRAIEREVYDREYEYHYRRYEPRRECYEAVTTRYDRWGYPVYERVLRCN